MILLVIAAIGLLFVSIINISVFYYIVNED